MSLALLTDLYELTMMAGYVTAGFMPAATFELYVRELPPNRSFLIAAGLEQALEYLENLRFTEADVEHLRTIPALRRVRPEFFDEYLPGFRFTGEVWAVEEGTPMFPPAPLLRVTAPLPEAQLVETALLALIGFQTSVASRAARIVHAASGRAVVEFGARRAHGLEAGVLAARAAFLSGCTSTSNVEAGRRFGIPVSGTMAHSWIMALSDELAAFQQYSAIFGDEAVLLLDTYDAIGAARSIVDSRLRPRSVRVDSGDLIALSRRIRDILDQGGLTDTRIFTSGDLDEWRIDEIVSSGAPVDGFGVGAALSTVSDAPSLGAIYKLVEIDRDGVTTPVMKRSVGKPTLPGCKQVWRVFENEVASEDVIEHVGAGLDVPSAVPLLQRVMSGGKRVTAPPTLKDLRSRSNAALATIPEGVRRIHDPERYSVRLGRALQASIERFTARTW